jgi:outer membrane protein assembly factor BamB
MTIDQLVFVGFRGYVVALDRDNGEIVWTNDKLESGYVALLVDGDRLIVSTNGYTYCLEPLTGEILWRNPLSGYGTGAPTLASVRGSSAHALQAYASSDAAAAGASASTTAAT